MPLRYLVASAGLFRYGLSLLPTLSEAEKQAMSGSLTFDSEGARAKDAMLTSMAGGLARDFITDVACRIPAAELSIDNGASLPHLIRAWVNVPATRVMAASMEPQKAINLAKATMNAILSHTPSWDQGLRAEGLPVLNYSAIELYDTPAENVAADMTRAELVRAAKVFTS